MMSGSFTLVSQDAGEQVLMSREFEAGEELDVSIKTTKPLAISYRVDLNQDEKDTIVKRAEQSGVFEDNYSCEVSQLPSGNGIGSLEGAYISMEPVDGEIKFRFQSRMDKPKAFEIYAKPAS